MARILYIPNRVIDTDGISDGASLFVYQSGTTTPVTLYSDESLTTPVSNPYVVPAGAAVPMLYHGHNGAIRLYVVSDSGEIDDNDPYLNILSENDLGGKTPVNVATIAALSAVSSPLAGYTRYLTQAGREGTFVFDSSNLSAAVTLDTQQGVYVAPSSDATGASGAWVRKGAKITPFHFGAVGDGVIAADGTISGTDDTAALQAAIAAAAATGKQLYAPAGKYRTTAVLVVPDRVTLIGDGFTAETSSTVGTKRPLAGTWFLFDHAGIGFYCRDDANPDEGKYFTSFDRLGTYRAQPAPGAGWTPTVYDEDFRVEHRVTLNRVMLFNPYKGVLVRGPGVLTALDLRGQPLNTGIEVERATDTQDWSFIHFWPYWSQDANVNGYTVDNAVAVRVTRADGLQIGTIFTWGYRWTLEGVDAAGALSGMAGFSINSCYADKCGGAIRIVSNNYSAYGSVGSIVCNSDSEVGSSGAAVEVSGSVVSTVDLGSMAVTRAHEEALKVIGAAHVVNVRPYKIESWDRLGLGKSAFMADDGATVNIGVTPRFVGGTAFYNQGTTGVIALPALIPPGKPLAAPQGFQSKRVSIPDDGVVSFDAPATEKTVTLHLTPASVPAAGNPAGSYWLRASASPSAVLVQATHTANVALFTIPLTGTTGADGNLSIAAANDGKIYIENRTGVARTFIVTMMGN